MSRHAVPGSSLIRIGWDNYNCEEALDELATFLTTPPGTVDEVALFIGWVHDYLPVYEMRKQMPVIHRALERLRALDLTVGINILTTLGHLDEQGPRMPPMDVPPMVGHDGLQALCQACPRSPALLDQTAERYRLAALEAPAFIWVDDDLRMAHHRPINYGCFCDLCVDQFSQFAGTPYTRDTLVAELSRDLWPAANPVRRQWLAFMGDTMGAILRRAEQAIHAVDPGIELGFMSSDMAWRGYSAGPLTHILGSLASDAMPRVRLRPGGGAYTDYGPMEFVRKAFSIALQNGAARGPNLGPVQSELESFPHQRATKSTHMTVFEASCYIAAGCNGTAFNILGGRSEALADFAPLAAGIAASRPFWRALAEACGDMPCVGYWPANAPDHEARRLVGEAGWPSGGDEGALYRTAALGDMGLPLADSPGAARGVALSGSQAAGYSADDLREVLSGAVILDGEALAWIERQGLTALVGVRRATQLGGHTLEEYTRDPLNGPLGGRYRDARIAFFPGGASWELEPLADDVRILSRSWTFADGPGEPCATLFANDLGGRVATLAYAPWLNNLQRAFRWTVNAAAAWTTRGAVPCQVLHPARVVPFLRLEDGNLVLALANCSFEDITHLDLLWSWPQPPARYLAPDGSWVALAADAVTDTTPPGFTEAVEADPALRVLRVAAPLAAWSVTALAPAG
jgi:hypothetical protein